MKKSFVAFMGAILLVLSALNIGILESQKSIVNSASAAGYDYWAFGPIEFPDGQICCIVRYKPKVGCDPYDQDWGCF